MESNDKVRTIIIDIVHQQIKTNEPPETKMAYERLKKLGYPKSEIEKHIAQCLVVELFDMMKNKKPYDGVRYKKNLNNLPESPLDEDEE